MLNLLTCGKQGVIDQDVVITTAAYFSTQLHMVKYTTTYGQ